VKKLPRLWDEEIPNPSQQSRGERRTMKIVETNIAPTPENLQRLVDEARMDKVQQVEDKLDGVSRETRYIYLTPQETLEAADLEAEDDPQWEKGVHFPIAEFSQEWPEGYSCQHSNKFGDCAEELKAVIEERLRFYRSREEVHGKGAWPKGTRGAA
jgi:hypothetical protein